METAIDRPFCTSVVSLSWHLAGDMPTAPPALLLIGGVRVAITIETVGFDLP
jgi:hypothetical protein